jgi:hypothetical protein
MISLVSRFYKWCNQYQQNSDATYSNIAGFLFSYVESNKGSTRSVSLVLGLLKRYFRLEGLNWLNESDSYKVQLFISELKYRDLSHSYYLKETVETFSLTINY